MDCYKILLLLTTAIFLSSCNANYQEARAKKEAIEPCYYAKLSGNKSVEYKQCLAKQAAAGPSGEGGTSMIEAIIGKDGVANINSGNNNTYRGSVNQWLWLGSMETLKLFPIKIADAFGGYIETEWLTNSTEPNKRCVVKVQINSAEFVSNGISASMICQDNKNGTWVMSNEDLLEKNIQIENSILTNAREKYNNT